MTKIPHYYFFYMIGFAVLPILVVILFVNLEVIGSLPATLLSADAVSLAFAQTSEELGYKRVQGSFEDQELGFSLQLPDSMEGFVYEYGSADEIRGLTLQIHPEFDSSSAPCCPVLDTTPAAILLTSDSLDTLTSPVPFTGDLFGAIQGYNMRMSIEELNNKQVLVATLDSERSDIPNYNSVKRVGKFYFINSDERYISYGLWASPENYQKYLAEFEESAMTVMIENATSVNLPVIFSQYITPDLEIVLKDGSILHPQIITPSIVESVAIDEESDAVRINIIEPSGNSFLIMNSGKLLAGPHTITLDGESIESKTLSNENGEYLIAFYDQVGNHGISITGTAVVPEFDSIALPLIAAGILGTIAVARMRQTHKSSSFTKS